MAWLKCIACAVGSRRCRELAVARYKCVDTNPQFLSVDLARQLLPGTFAYALNHLLDHEVDLTHFDARFRNDTTGAPTYPPALLLKVVLFAYSQGIVRNRAIERVCQEHVTFMALCSTTASHFTTIAYCVSTLRDDIARVLAAVLAVCNGQGLIRREMFAIDGVKLPSNASKHRSGTRAAFTQRAEKRESAAQTILDRHRATDALELEPDVAAKTTTRIARLTKDAQQLREWLASHPTDRHGPTGGLRQSNRTDNERAKMATETGVLHGYTGVAAVDAKHQIIVDAQAHGTGSEQELLGPVVTALAALRTSETVLTADASYHSEANLAALAALAINALIADPELWKRDERFAARAHHTNAPNLLHEQTREATHERRSRPLFAPSDCTYDADARTCVRPAGKLLYRKGASNITNGYVGEHFRGAKRDCAPCALRDRCLRTPTTTVVRNVAFFHGREDAATEAHTMRMQQRLATPEGRAQYGQRFATVEPVFANVRFNKRLDRFTLRGRTKVNGQWLLHCLVHNIEKLTHAGYAA